MKSKRMLLLRTFLKASSSSNFLKYSKDKAKRSRVIGNLFAFGIIYAMMLGYVLMISIGLGQNGMASMIPATCAGMLIGVSFLFTLLKTNGYLYGFREYDTLISMPFTEKDIVSAKFLYMYVKSLPIVIVMSIASLIGYLIAGAGNVLTVILWLLLSLVLPILPMILASAIGAIIVRIGINFKHKKLIQTILTFIIIIPCFFLNFIIQDIAKNNKFQEVLEKTSGFFDKASKIFSTSDWFVKAVNDNNLLYALLLIAVTVVIFELFFAIVCKSYRMMNARLVQSAAGKKYKMTTQKARSMVKSIAFKEFRRMTGSTTYLVQIGMGFVLTAILGIVCIFIKGEVIVDKVTQGAPVPPGILIPAIPLIVYFLAGMVPSTTCSPSLEGKNYWIMQTLPIDPLVDCKGKLLFQWFLSIPISVFAVLTMSFSFGTSVVEALAGCVAIICLCMFSSLWGLSCGIRFKKLDWDNEIEVVKQSAAVTVYLLPNMFVTMGLIAGVIFLNYLLKNVILIYGVLSLVALLLGWLSWLSVRKMIKKRF